MTINIDDIPNTDDNVIKVNRRETLIRVTPTGADSLQAQIDEINRKLTEELNQSTDWGIVTQPEADEDFNNN